MTDQPPVETATTVVDHEYITIVHEPRTGSPDLYHVEDALERLKSFESQGKAELYADVYTVVGGFREEKTSECGVPAAIAAAREGRSYGVPDRPAYDVP